jgi:hypothetical protein
MLVIIGNVCDGMEFYMEQCQFGHGHVFRQDRGQELGTLLSFVFNFGITIRFYLYESYFFCQVPRDKSHSAMKVSSVTSPHSIVVEVFFVQLPAQPLS